MKRERKITRVKSEKIPYKTHFYAHYFSFPFHYFFIILYFAGPFSNQQVLLAENHAPKQNRERHHPQEDHQNRHQEHLRVKHLARRELRRVEAQLRERRRQLVAGDGHVEVLVLVAHQQSIDELDGRTTENEEKLDPNEKRGG